MLVEDFILVGKKNGVSQADLARIANVPERMIRREVEEARISRKKLIIGDESGYYFPESEADIAGYVSRRKASIRTSQKALVPFLKALRR